MFKTQATEAFVGNLFPALFSEKYHDILPSIRYRSGLRVEAFAH